MCGCRYGIEGMDIWYMGLIPQPKLRNLDADSCSTADEFYSLEPSEFTGAVAELSTKEITEVGALLLLDKDRRIIILSQAMSNIKTPSVVRLRL